MRKSVDLNCDMGEGFGHWTLGEAPDEDLIELITSANVATGFHAGDPSLMNRVAGLCRQHSVALGAHPGFRDLVGFGRRPIRAPADELVNDILYQIGALREFGRRHGLALQHVKPHGALYMEAAANEDLSRHLVETLRTTAPDLILFCMDISVTCEVARRLGQPVVREFYADRDYDDSGSIVFTRRVAAPDPATLARKCLRACREGVVETVTGKDIPIAFEFDLLPFRYARRAGHRPCDQGHPARQRHHHRPRGGGPRPTKLTRQERPMNEILSPLPGTFYHRPAPDAAPFMAAGTAVAIGDTIGLVEVMKTFIEIKAEVAGTFVAYVTGDADPVMAGAVLATLE
ncbi:acetyl-CoA carboxylase [Paenirhodobacter sp.]|uniref:acetyl-CoA carboxylase n=1 Tax=Paenirhodobacter sp. TaxID=1965326 RepID=UPI003B3D3AF3